MMQEAVKTDTRKKNAARAAAQQLRFKPTTPQDQAPQGQGWSIGGFAENVLQDAFGIVKGLYQIFPTAGKAAYDILSDPAGMKLLLDHPEHLTKAFGDTAVALKDSFIEPYQKHGLAVGYYRPVSTILDAFAVNGLLANGVKTAGRVAGNRALESAGLRMERFPAEITRKAVDKAVHKLSGGKWDLAKRREYLHIKAEEASQIPLKIAEDYKNVGQKVAALTDEEAALWDKWRKLGYSNADAAAYPKVAEALESYRGLASTWHETLAKRGLLDDARAMGALEKKYAAEAFRRIDDETLAAARQAILKAERKPIYGPAMFEQKIDDIGTMIDRFIDMSRTSKGGRTNFLEEYKGKEGSITDPRKYVPEAIKNFRHVEGRLRFDERVIQNYGSLPAAGREKLPMGVNRKHFDSEMRARAFDSIQDPTIKRLLKLERNIAGDPVRVVINLYDRMLNLWRKMATSWNPAYYTGNVIGDAVLGTLAGSDWIRAQRLVAQGAMPPQGMAKVGMAPGGYVERLKDIANSADQAARAGIITAKVAKEITANAALFERSAGSLDEILRSTQRLSDTQVQLQLLQENIARNDRRVIQIDRMIQSGLKSEAALRARIERVSGRAGGMMPQSPEVARLEALRQKIVNITKMRDDMVRDLADDAMKASNMEARIPGLKEQNDIVRTAVAYANDFIGNYLGLDGFEQGVVRRAIPFYPFVKAMNMLAFKLPFINPVKTFLWHRYSMALWSMVGDPELPEWTKGYVPVFAKENGDLVWIRVSRYSPFEGLRTTKFADVPIPGGAAVHEQNPFIGLAIRYAGGKTIFDKTGLPYGEPMVNISNGDVYEFGQDGKLRKTVPQTPLVSGLMHALPITQYIQSIITPYVANKYNWVGFPEPVLNPDGTYKYPRELHERLAALLGVKTMDRSKESIIQSERSKVIQAIKGYQKAYQRADPQERELIKQVLEDYQRGEYRRIGQ